MALFYSPGRLLPQYYLGNSSHLIMLHTRSACLFPSDPIKSPIADYYRTVNHSKCPPLMDYDKYYRYRSFPHLIDFLCREFWLHTCCQPCLYHHLDRAAMLVSAID